MRSWLAAELRDATFRVEFANDNPAPPGWGPQGRRIPRFHMVSLRSGRLWYEIDGDRRAVRPGEVAFVSPGVVHSADEDPKHRPHLLTCRFEMVGRGGRPRRPRAPFSAFLAVGDRRAFEEQFARLYRGFRYGRSPLDARACDAIVTQIVCELAREAEGAARRADTAIDRVRQRIEECPERRAAVADLARAAGLSRRTFFRRFRAAHGCTPAAFQIRARCDRARTLLLTTALSVKEIAHRLGYADQYTFSKQFKSVVGSSPSRFRALQ